MTVATIRLQRRQRQLAALTRHADTFRANGLRLLPHEWCGWVDQTAAYLADLDRRIARFAADLARYRDAA